MINILLVYLTALGGVTLINLLLTLRLIRLQRTNEDIRARMASREILPELTPGEQAPDFKVKTLSGEWVRLAAYAGRSIAFIFVSPHCGSCRKKMPMLTHLSVLAKESAGIEFVLVSDSGAAETYTWVDAIHEEDKVEINMQTLIAPRQTSEFYSTYNPRSLTPYYCIINEQGIVQARDPLGMGEWPNLQRKWEGQNSIQSRTRFV